MTCIEGCGERGRLKCRKCDNGLYCADCLELHEDDCEEGDQAPYGDDQ